MKNSVFHATESWLSLPLHTRSTSITEIVVRGTFINLVCATWVNVSGVILAQSNPCFGNRSFPMQHLHHRHHNLTSLSFVPMKSQMTTTTTTKVINLLKRNKKRTSRNKRKRNVALVTIKRLRLAKSWQHSVVDIRRMCRVFTNIMSYPPCARHPKSARGWPLDWASRIVLFVEASQVTWSVSMAEWYKNCYPERPRGITYGESRKLTGSWIGGLSCLTRFSKSLPSPGRRWCVLTKPLYGSCERMIQERRCSKRGTFQFQLKNNMRDVIRKWAGLAPMARITNQHTSQDFCLHTIVEVGLIFQFTNLYLKVQRPRGLDVPPFITGKN